MSNEFINVGRRLPSGITLEVGYVTTAQGSGGAPFVRYRTLADYTAVTLKGTSQHLLVRDPGTRKVLTTLPGCRNAEPYINQVPKDFWDRWCKEHPGSWLVTSGQLFVIPKPDAATVKAVTTDAKAKSPEIFQPLDSKVPFKIEDHSISPRVDE
jgi:hypothetical protein